MKKEYWEQVSALGRYFGQINELYNIWAKQHGLSYNKLAVFYTLVSQGSATQRQICQEWGISKQTLSTICKELEKEGIITSVVIPQDKREKQIQFTEAGSAMIAPLIKELQVLERNTLKIIGEKKVDTWFITMQQFIEVFSEQSRSAEAK